MGPATILTIKKFKVVPHTFHKAFTKRKIAGKLVMFLVEKLVAPGFLNLKKAHFNGLPSDANMNDG